MKVNWQTMALNGRDRVADYIRKQFGAKHKNLFLQHVRQTTKMLRRNPNIGAIDPLFADRPETYRSVVVDDLSKMVYRYDEDEKIIHIVALWDCRMDPSTVADRVK